MQLCFAPFAVGFSCKSEKMDRNLLDRARICYYNSMAVEVIAIIRSLVNTVWYRSGYVCERCRWQKKRAKRSGRGRTKSSANGCEDFFGVPQQDITGLVPLKEKLNSRLHSFRSLTYTVWYRSGHNGTDSKYFLVFLSAFLKPLDTRIFKHLFCKQRFCLMVCLKVLP